MKSSILLIMNEDYLPEGVKKIQGQKPGKTVAIFAGVHGNEKAGVYALEKLENELKNIIESGVAYLVYGNPLATEKDTRYIDKNLNRCFLANQGGATYEEKRAVKLMALLDQCDALLDVHASNTPDSTPFLIGESSTKDFANKLPFSFFVTGFDAVEPGATDGYMFNQGKFGLCAECGFSGEGEKYKDLAYHSMVNFLKYFGVISGDISAIEGSQQEIHVYKAIIKPSDEFVFIKEFKDFDKIQKGELYATDGDIEYRVDRDSVIIFAGSHKKVGEEACILGELV